MSRLPYVFYRLYSWLYRLGLPFIPKVLMVANRIVFGAYVPPSCVIGKGAQFSYGGSGVVLHGRSILGKNCVIGTGVTIGGRGRHSRGQGGPVIGDNVWIATGAKILGPITIGDDSVIGANAVVIKDVPPNSVVAGVPARVIGQNKNSADYY
jgi:serine O-acetyltransferase